VEFGNRLVTGAVSVAVIAAVLASHRRRPYRADLVRLAWGLVAGVVAQIAVGALTVVWHLPPGVVMVHFLLSMVLVWNATVLWLRAGDEERAAGPPRRPDRSPAAPARLVLAIAAVTPVVLVTGTVVTAAGPHRGDEDVEPLDLAISSVARVHGFAVVALVALVAATMAVAARQREPEALRRALEITMAVLVAQGVVGYVQYFTDVPAGLVAVHVVGATATVVAVTHLVHVARIPAARPAAVGLDPVMVP